MQTAQKLKISFSDRPSKKFVARFLTTESIKSAVGLSKIFQQEKFKAEKNTGCYIADANSKRLLIMGLGDAKNVTAEIFRQAVGLSVKSARARKSDVISIEIPSLQGIPKDILSVAAVEAACLANYVFDKYKTVESERPQKISSVEIAGAISAAARRDTLEMQKVCETINDAMFMVDESSYVATPSYLSKYVSSDLRKSRLKVDVLNEKQIKKLKMNLVLAVSRAAESAPAIVVAQYNGNPSSKDKTLFVGKGITYDTGGLDLKPGDSMLTMRADMAGAAAVYGLMKSLATTRAKTNAIGIMIFVENLIDTKAYRNGDTFVSMKGLTVEVGSTDAEGRLILADGLYYGVKRFNPTNVVDYSTLTGSARATFGEHFAGIVSNNDALAAKMHAAGQECYERVWQLPLTEEYMNELKGEVADLRSVNKLRFNGAIFGGAFLSKFVEEKPFVHVDMAPTAFLENNEKPYFSKGATGFGIRLGLEFLKRIQ